MAGVIKDTKLFIEGCVTYLTGLVQLGTLNKEITGPLVIDGVTVFNLEDVGDAYSVLATYYRSFFHTTNRSELKKKQSDCTGVVDIRGDEIILAKLKELLKSNNISIEKKEMKPISENLLTVSTETIIRWTNFGIPLSLMATIFGTGTTKGAVYNTTRNNLLEGMRTVGLDTNKYLDATNLEFILKNTNRDSSLQAARLSFLTSTDIILLRSFFKKHMSPEQSLGFVKDVFGYERNKLSSAELEAKYTMLNGTAMKDVRRSFGCLQVKQTIKHYSLLDGGLTASYQQLLNAFKMLTFGMSIEDTLLVTKSTRHEEEIRRMWDTYEGDLLGLIEHIKRIKPRGDIMMYNTLYVFENFWYGVFYDIPSQDRKKWYTVKNGCLNFDRLNSLRYQSLKLYSYGELFEHFMSLSDNKENRMLLANLVAALRQKYYAKGTDSLRRNLGEYSRLLLAFSCFDTTDSFVIQIGNPVWAYLKVESGHVYSLRVEEAEKYIAKATQEYEVKERTHTEEISRILRELLNRDDIEDYYSTVITEDKDDTEESDMNIALQEVASTTEIEEETTEAMYEVTNFGSMSPIANIKYLISEDYTVDEIIELTCCKRNIVETLYSQEKGI